MTTVYATSVYVVMGTTGEYSDRSEWPVAAYLNQYAAETHVNEATRVAQEIESRRANKYRGGEFTSPYDPQIRMDYTGTTYFINVVPLATEAPPLGQNAERCAPGGAA